MNGRMVIHLTVLLFLWFSHSLETIDSNSNPRISHLNCIELERKALLELKDSLIDPLGQLSTWSGFDCCSWTGIFCDSQTHHVIKLDLQNRHTQPYIPSGLGGMLSLALLNLKHLNYLDLSQNDFYKIPIPSFIGSLENLNHLDLSLTRFEGEVPPQLGNLSSLHYLKLTTLTPWAKDLNWVSSLGSLRYIDLSGVDLSRIENNWLQPFSMIPFVKELHLRFCNLNYSQYSTLIDFSIANLTSLSVVDLSGNFFDSVPRWLFNITSLRQLGLLRSNIKGPIFQLPWRILCKLQILYLSHNTINDDVGKFIRALSECGNSSLQRLTLQNNHFMGDLGELVRIRNLRSLRLYDNWISGPIPFSIGNLSCLEELDFSYNKMNGSIPESLGNLAELIHLDIEQNFWDGALTGNHLRSLKKLEILAISSANKGFVFDVPSYWVPPLNLKSITISDCNLGPDFPPWLRTQTNISSIVLRNVQILEQIPNWFWNMTSQITELDLSSNQIEGVLPKNLKFSSAVIVDLRHNRLRGTIPLWSNVPRLFLGNNGFHGPIPSEIGCAMSSVRVLDLSHNSISGSIPLFICEMKNLVSLDLSDNNLSGEILNIWKALPNLRHLDLSENNLYGKIPSSICSLPSINWLMMSGNNLSGELSLFYKIARALRRLTLEITNFRGVYQHGLEKISYL